ncbi:MAG: hypothetical protein K2N22_00870 [Clostridia bacterium]|nr:hypothetical protein [Clostridia bacterium]
MPKTTDTITTDYDKNPHTLNFTYADKVTSNDLDGKQHEYAIGYKNVTVTIDAKDGDGNTITAPTLNLDENEGKGSITATDTGTYTVRFNLSPGTISNGIEWVGGGTGEKTIVLTINKIDPKVNPIFGEPEEVDGNPGKWYTSNDLYNDITIETTAGDTAGTISWDASQSLSSGTKNYGWTFTPTDTRNYNKKTGTKSITVESIAIASIKATFNQGTAKFYTSSKLDDLKVKLSVDKVYSDGSTARLANADYELSGDISSAGTATITVTYTSLNTEDPALEEFTDTFEVDITAVAVKSISASFNPTADIYLSNSLEDLKQYLTVNATYNDGKTKNNISNYTLSTDSGALALGTVTVTVTSDEDNTVSDTFEVEVIPDIVPVVLPLPQAKDYTYSGEELDVVGALTTLKEEDVIKYLDVTGTASARRAGIYTVKFKIKDEFIAAGNTSWDVSNLGDLDGVTVSADGNSVEFKWNILKAKVAAKWDSEECLWVPVIVGTLAETTEPNFLINTYTNSDGNEFKNREKLAGGRTYQVTAAVNPQYANDFELDESSQALINSGSETYTYTPPYVPGIWERILNFLKANWLWFVIALAAIILLIVIIVVAKKCHKTKEQREEIKARKEEEKARREEERRLQREKLEAEREIARARQEAELEKMRMQAQAGMAAVAPSVSRGVPSAPEYTGDSSASVSQRERYDGMTRMDNSVLQEIRAELAELRARQNMGAGYPVQPYQQPQGYENNRIAQLEFEVAKIKAEAELKSVGADERMKTMYFSHPSAMPTERFDAADKKGITAELLGEAIMTAFAKFAANNAKPAELPEPEPETAAAQAIYPPDAIVTTTTTVDTTKKTDAAIRREREDTFVDVDGFYDSID